MEQGSESDPLVVYTGEIQELIGHPQGERSAQAAIEATMRQAIAETPVADYLAARAEYLRLDALYKEFNKLDIGPDNVMDIPGLMEELGKERDAAEAKAYKIGEPLEKELARVRMYGVLWENVTGKDWGSEKVTLTPLVRVE